MNAEMNSTITANASSALRKSSRSSLNSWSRASTCSCWEMTSIDGPNVLSMAAVTVSSEAPADSRTSMRS